MSPQELFGVVVRSTGLLFVALALYNVTGAIRPSPGYTAMDFLEVALPMFGIGAGILVLADRIVSLAYYQAAEHESAAHSNEPQSDDR
jgi:hypothetical protein